jgi:hypothetical protein
LVTSIDVARSHALSPGRALPDPTVEPVIKLPRVARILGISVRAAHYAADRGQIPCVRVDRCRLVPTAEFLDAFRLRRP